MSVGIVFIASFAAFNTPWDTSRKASDVLIFVIVMKANPLSAAFVNDKYGKKLLDMLSEFSSNPYMPIFLQDAVIPVVTEINADGPANLVLLGMFTILDHMAVVRLGFLYGFD